MTQNPATPQIPSFNPSEMMNLYLQGKHELLCDQFLNVIDFFRKQTFEKATPSSQYFINTFVKHFLNLFTQPDFRLENDYGTRFINYNRTISNIVAISSFGTTDAYLEILRDQTANFAKILTLYSARNTVQFDRKALFDVLPGLASLWYLEYASIFYSGMASPIVHKNLQEHFNFNHPGLVITHNFQELYFGSTYVDGVCDRPIKAHINRSLQTFVKTLPPIRNKPDKKKIAVISTSWVPTHSVYRTLSAYVQSLKPKYHLTHIQPGNYGKQETGMFDDSFIIATVNGKPDMSRLLESNFQAVFLPDVGMCAESILLANMRIAPIQMMSTGHPVSTFGSEVDYFMSGVDVEGPNAENNYSERLVLLPGMGAIHNRPSYVPRERKKEPNETLLINCPWFAQKINYPFMATVKKLLDGMKRKVMLRIFVGVSTSGANDHLPFVREITRQLGSDRVEIYSHLEYQRYMEIMEPADMAIDPFHFGGSNIVSDSICLRMPTVTWEGSKWYARIGSQMLRLIGVADCIATNETEYLEKIWHLAHNDEAREAVRKRMQAADLENTVYSTKEAQYFLDAVDYLIENNDRLKAEKDRTPIRIPVR